MKTPIPYDYAAVRKLADWTLDQLALAVGAPRTAVHSLECGMVNEKLGARIRRHWRKWFTGNAAKLPEMRRRLLSLAIDEHGEK